MQYNMYNNNPQIIIIIMTYIDGVYMYCAYVHIMVIRLSLLHMRLVPTGNLETLLMQYMNRLNSTQRSIHQLSINNNNWEKGNLV